MQGEDEPGAGGGPPRRRPKILVVDDNQAIVEETVDFLERQGYGVISAASGREAMAALELDEHIGLLLTDMVMPGGLTGQALAAGARKLRPDLKVLFASGQFDGSVVGDANVGFIAKPFRMRELAAKVAGMFGRPA